MSSLLHGVRSAVGAGVVVLESGAEVIKKGSEVAVVVADEFEKFAKEGLPEFMGGVTSMAKGFRFEQALELEITYTGQLQKKEYLKDGITEEQFATALANVKTKLNIQ